MNMRQLKRAHSAASLHQAREAAAQQARDHLHAMAAEEGWYEDDDDDPWNDRDTTCRHCSGTGGDPWNDGITPCEHCDGEGYEWWN